MFRPVPTRPDLVGLEHELLGQWRERGTFAKLRAQNAGGPRWSFLDGPITANNPMGVHHAWGRTYKDLFQRFHAMLGADQRWQNGFDCQGLWVEVNVERDLGFTSKRDIEAVGIAEFVSLCKQRVLTYAARQTEQSTRLGMWMDWDEPDELRRLRDALAADPGQVVTIQGPNGPLTDTAEMLVGRLGHPELGGSYYTFSNENNDLIWGFLAECHRRGWIYKGHDSMPWCPRCGTGLSQMEMNEGYQDREDPGLTVRFPLVDRPGESLLVSTTTPWTLAANVAAAGGEKLEYVPIRQGEASYWIGKGTPLLFRLVDEWFISMGEVYDQPRETLSKEQLDASLRYQIMEVVDEIRWIPSFGYERELDWLLNMHDWMISKKRYWGLALPIYDCTACGTFDVIGGRGELRERAISGWEAFDGHTPHRPYVDEVAIACPGCGDSVRRIPDVGNPWLDAGIVPFSTLHYREAREHWARWFA